MKSGEFDGINTSIPALGSSSNLSSFPKFFISFNYSIHFSKSLVERLKGNTFLNSFKIENNFALSSTVFFSSYTAMYACARIANLGQTCSLGALDLLPSKDLKSLIYFQYLSQFVSRLFSDTQIYSYRLIKNDLYWRMKVS